MSEVTALSIARAFLTTSTMDTKYDDLSIGALNELRVHFPEFTDIWDKTISALLPFSVLYQA